MYRSLILVLAMGCAVDNGFHTKDDTPGGEPDDSGAGPDTDTDDTSPTDEECNGADDDGDGAVDEDFPDADGNGRVDCLDVTCPALDLGTPGTVEILEECRGTLGTEVTDPWNAAIEYQYTSVGQGVIVLPVVGNLNDDNGDGAVDEADIPEIVFTTWYGNTLVALDGATGAELFEVSGYDGQAGVTIADVDADGAPEVVAIQTGYRIAAVDATGRAEWVSASFGMMMYPQPTVADLDNDGMPEVIADVGVVNGETAAPSPRSRASRTPGARRSPRTSIRTGARRSSSGTGCTTRRAAPSGATP
ncbi:MAG: FG-GAP repeat domain-containing protein, partial [Myxococcota bacterium]